VISKIFLFRDLRWTLTCAGRARRQNSRQRHRSAEAVLRKRASLRSALPASTRHTPG
jgi:hypothetical protein